MKATSKKLLDTVAEVLNEHVHNQSPAGKMLSGALPVEGNRLIVELLNDVLSRVAEGGKLLLASESDGTLLGFVPRYALSLPGIISPAEEDTSTV